MTMNDSHLGRVQKYADQESSDYAQAAAEPEPQYQPRDVRVRSCAPEQTRLFTKIVSTGTQPVDLLLPQDPNRNRAVVTALDEPVVLCSTKELAQDPRNAGTGAGLPAAGYVLSIGTQLIIESRGAVWIAATSATAGRVSVMVDVYEQDA